MDNMFEFSAMNQDLSDWPVVSIQSAANIFANPTTVTGVTFPMISEYYPNFPLYNPTLAAIPDAYYSASATPPAVGATFRAVVAVSSTGLTARINMTGTGLNIDWGDGSAPSGAVSHAYANAGTYVITITGNGTSFTGIVDNANVSITILSLPSWFNTITDLSYAFANQPYNFTVPKYLPSSVTTLNSMFIGASSFNQPLNSWNTSTVTDMSSIFINAVSFDQPLNLWQTGLVTNMSSMFAGAVSFNGDVRDWNTGSLENASNMFGGAKRFNRELPWDTSSITNIAGMFNGAASFNQSLHWWGTASVTDMSNLFTNAVSFNQPLSMWNTAAVTNMTGMFNGAISFNKPLNSWDTSQVTFMNDMFNGASSFNQPLASWNTSSVSNMSGMFNNATAFNGSISSWDTSSVTSMYGMFTNASSFNQPLIHTTSPNVWSTQQLVNMNYMFYGAVSFNQDLSSWDTTSKVTAMQIFGNGAPIATNSAYWPPFSFPDPVSNPISYTGGMRIDVTVSTSDITAGSITLKMGFLPAQRVTVDWGDSSAADQWSSAPSHTYASAGTYTVTVTGTANAFNGIVNAARGVVTITSVTPWLDSLTDLSSLFAGQQGNFTAPLYSLIKTLPSPPPTYLRNLSNMFNGAVAFDGTNIDTWDTATVTDMSNMFNGATAVNKSIANWDIGSLVTAKSLFANSPNFISTPSNWPNFVNNPNLPNPEYYTS